MFRWYIAGPMTGIPQFNVPLFDAAAAALRGKGFDVTSPAELDNAATREVALASPDGAPGSGVANGETWGDFLARDVKLIADGIDGIITLPGWKRSRGARLEVFVGLLCGKHFAAYNPETGEVTPSDPDDIRRILRDHMPNVPSEKLHPLCDYTYEPPELDEKPLGEGPLTGLDCDGESFDPPAAPEVGEIETPAAPEIVEEATAGVELVDASPEVQAAADEALAPVDPPEPLA